MSGKKMTIARRMRIVSISCAILVEDVGDIGGSDTGVATLVGDGLLVLPRRGFDMCEGVMLWDRT